MKKILLLGMLCTSIAIHAQANKEDVKRYIEISGSASKYDEMIERVASQVSLSKKEDFKKDLIYFKNKMVSEMVIFYAAKFSQDEIEVLIEIYESPLGKKMVQANNEFSSNYGYREQEFQREIGRLIMKYMN